MHYELSIDGAPDSVPAGTAILLFHPSTGGTDRFDTGFLKEGTDRFLVVSTRTTADEVKQKLEHYEVDVSRADILDTLSVERGYSRRNGENLHYVNAPDDVEGILDVIERFLADHSGKRRISFDSLSELAYYAGDDAASDALERIVSLLSEYDAVGMFHVSPEVHDPSTLRHFRSVGDGFIEVDAEGSVTSTF